MNSRQLYFVSLGCARNQVDSELMLGALANKGWQVCQDPAEAHAIVINTCSFIESAADESIETILDLSRYKTRGRCQHLVVAGCLPERYRDDIGASLPEVDAFLGTGAYHKIVEILSGKSISPAGYFPDPDRIDICQNDAPRKLSESHSAYVKIAEGCDNRCTYCIITKLRGRQKSRSLPSITREVQMLVDQGVKELVLVAQESTRYGHDLRPPVPFWRLLENLAQVAGPNWVRFLYGHPGSLDQKMIDTVARHQNICPYFDLPIQHAHNAILKKMGRSYTQKQLYKLLGQIRSRLPQAAIRTTIIVGFPGEADAHFDALLKFVEMMRFDHLGVFIYSDAEDLASYALRNKVPLPIARARQARLMSLQKKISAANNLKQVGKTYPVLIESNPEAGVYMGRTQFQAPEVDGLTYVYAKDLSIGEFVEVAITDAMEYDLVGEAL